MSLDVVGPGEDGRIAAGVDGDAEHEQIENGNWNQVDLISSDDTAGEMSTAREMDGDEDASAASAAAAGIMAALAAAAVAAISSAAAEIIDEARFAFSRSDALENRPRQHGYHLRWGGSGREQLNPGEPATTGLSSGAEDVSWRMSSKQSTSGSRDGGAASTFVDQRSDAPDEGREFNDVSVGDGRRIGDERVLQVGWRSRWRLIPVGKKCLVLWPLAQAALFCYGSCRATAEHRE